jgi:hypothetical protein
MSVSPDQRVRFDGGEVVTPRLRSTGKRLVFWLLVLVAVVLIAVISLVTVGVAPSKARLSPTNAGPSGAEALINVLRNDGVSVLTTRTLKALTEKASGSPDDTTIVVYDPHSYLDAAQLESLPILGSNVVLILPSSRALAALAPGVHRAGAASYNATAGCSYGPAKRAGTVSGMSRTYSISLATTKAEGCLATGSTYSIARVRYREYTVTVVGGTVPFTNQSIPLSGNAALALGMFGATDHLIWYRPSFADLPSTTPDGAPPTPPWVPLAIALAGIVLLAAAVWRGRRLGPLVVERMPVVVRSSETLEGRARLYQKASARSHALDALRVGTASRLAILLGLPKLATVDEIIAAAAAATGGDTQAIRSVLLDETPATDRQLVGLSDRLRELEEDVAAAVVPA